MKSTSEQVNTSHEHRAHLELEATGQDWDSMSVAQAWPQRNAQHFLDPQQQRMQELIRLAPTTVGRQPAFPAAGPSAAQSSEPSSSRTGPNVQVRLERNQEGISSRLAPVVGRNHPFPRAQNAAQPPEPSGGSSGSTNRPMM